MKWYSVISVSIELELSDVHSMLSGFHVTTEWHVLRLWIWRVAVYILNKQLQTVNKRGGPPALGLNGGANNSSPQKKWHVTKYYTGPWTDSSY
jgi:hypothetical protein